MHSEAKANFNLIFDPISKSALIQSSDRVIRLAGPFATYRDAMSAAEKSMANSAAKK